MDRTIAQILVPTDVSPASDAAVDWRSPSRGSSAPPSTWCTSSTIRSPQRQGGAEVYVTTVRASGRPVLTVRANDHATKKRELAAGELARTA